MARTLVCFNQLLVEGMDSKSRRSEEVTGSLFGSGFLVTTLSRSSPTQFFCTFVCLSGLLQG